MASNAQDMDTLERIKLEITERLEEIRPIAQEVTELEAALNALGGASSTVTPRRKTAQKRAHPRHSSTSNTASNHWENLRQQRMKDVIDIVTEKGLREGFTTRDIEELCVRYNVLKKNLTTTVLNPMEERGLITRIGSKPGGFGGPPSVLYRLEYTPQDEAVS